MTMDSTGIGPNDLPSHLPGHLMDAFGRALLKELQDNARLSIAELARRVGLSATATAERMKQMEEAGIVRGFTVEIDREALGLEVLAFIRLTCEGQHYYRLMEFVQTLEEVRECHHLTGGDAFLLKVTTTSMSNLEALIEALLPFGNPVTSVVLSTPIERRKYAVTGKLTTVTKKRASWSGKR
jgi:Lrp/AsnC family leucine-responsive transcriptional regulator